MVGQLLRREPPSSFLASYCRGGGLDAINLRPLRWTASEGESEAPPNMVAFISETLMPLKALRAANQLFVESVLMAMTRCTEARQLDISCKVCGDAFLTCFNRKP